MDITGTVGRRALSIRRGYIDLPDELGGGQIHYRRAGNVAAPSLVLLHQTPSSSEMYLPLMQALSADFDMLALDTPGFGMSDPLGGEFTIGAAAQVLAAAVSQLVIGPCYWFGHHTGAALALQVAHTHPEQVAALALSGPCLLDDNLKQRLPQLAAPIETRADGGHLQALWQRMQAKDDQADKMIWQRETLIAADAGTAYPQAYAAVVELDTAGQLAALRCPSLMLAGTEDPLYGQLEGACALAPGAQRAEIEGAKTFVCERNTLELGAHLRRFFGGLNV